MNFNLEDLLSPAATVTLEVNGSPFQVALDDEMRSAIQVAFVSAAHAVINKRKHDAARDEPDHEKKEVARHWPKQSIGRAPRLMCEDAATDGTEAPSEPKVSVQPSPFRTLFGRIHRDAPGANDTRSVSVPKGTISRLGIHPKHSARARQA